MRLIHTISAFPGNVSGLDLMPCWESILVNWSEFIRNTKYELVNFLAYLFHGNDKQCRSLVTGRVIKIPLGNFSVMGFFYLTKVSVTYIKFEFIFDWRFHSFSCRSYHCNILSRICINPRLSKSMSGKSCFLICYIRPKMHLSVLIYIPGNLLDVPLFSNCCLRC